MKRMIALLLTLVMVCSVTACGQKTMGEEVKGGMSEEHLGMVVDAVKMYGETGAYKAMEDDPTTEEVETGIAVSNAMYYRADGAVEGIDLQVLLVELDVNGDIFGSSRFLVIDLRDGAVYDEAALDMGNYMGQMETYEDLTKMAFGGYDSFLSKINPSVMTELEVRTPATNAQLKEINAAVAD